MRCRHLEMWFTHWWQLSKPRLGHSKQQFRVDSKIGWEVGPSDHLDLEFPRWWPMGYDWRKLKGARWLEVWGIWLRRRVLIYRAVAAHYGGGREWAWGQLFQQYLVVIVNKAADGGNCIFLTWHNEREKHGGAGGERLNAWEYVSYLLDAFSGVSILGVKKGKIKFFLHI